MKHLVITGPPDSGKSTRARELARDQDVIWDFDRIAAAALVRYDDGRPRDIPPAAFDALLSMRQGLLLWAMGHDPEVCRVIVTVVDRHSGERIAGTMDADLIALGE